MAIVMFSPSLIHLSRYGYVYLMKHKSETFEKFKELQSDVFVQIFYFHPKKSPPSVEFHLYDEAREMSLREFCAVCKIPLEGSIKEPHRRDVDGFIGMITVGETRKISDARISSIHFPVLRYFAIFASRCLIGHGNCENLSVPDIVILCHALFRDTLLV